MVIAVINMSVVNYVLALYVSIYISWRSAALGIPD